MLIAGKRLISKLPPENLVLDIKTSNDIKLDQVSSDKLLGVSLDQDLTFDEHVVSVCKKRTQRIGLLRSIRFCPNKNVLYHMTPLVSFFNIRKCRMD